MDDTLTLTDVDEEGDPSVPDTPPDVLRSLRADPERRTLKTLLHLKPWENLIYYLDQAELHLRLAGDERDKNSGKEYQRLDYAHNTLRWISIQDSCRENRPDVEGCTGLVGAMHRLQVQALHLKRCMLGAVDGPLAQLKRLWDELRVMVTLPVGVEQTDT